jgi:hypothetical protein
MHLKKILIILKWLWNSIKLKYLGISHIKLDYLELSSKLNLFNKDKLVISILLAKNKILAKLNNKLNY